MYEMITYYHNSVLITDKRSAYDVGGKKSLITADMTLDPSVIESKKGELSRHYPSTTTSRKHPLYSSQDCIKYYTHHGTGQDADITCPSLGYRAGVPYLGHRRDYNSKRAKERE